MFTYLILKILSLVVVTTSAGYLLFTNVSGKRFLHFLGNRKLVIPIVLVLAGFLGLLFSHTTRLPSLAMPPFMKSLTPDQEHMSPNLPLINIFTFFKHLGEFEQVSDIAANPRLVPATPLIVDTDGVVRISLKTKEVISELAPGVYQNYWTYNGTVPGPMLRIKEGDHVELTLENDRTSLHEHNIDLHAVNGPGGGTALTQVKPGESRTFRFTALNPGLYVYHCAKPNVSTHNSHGQYGLILVDPKDPKLHLNPVNKEFYLMQGEFYTTGGIGKRGLMVFDSKGLVDGTPTYVVFNGKVEEQPRLQAKVGDTIRIYIGNGGVNLISSFHVIGEVFDTVYPEANIGGSIEHNVQTTSILPGGASIVEFTVNVPGQYVLVDHALARMNKGAWAILDVEGDDQPKIFSPVD